MKVSNSLVWDADNRLGFYDTSTGTDTMFVYDTDGNRILRVHGASSTTYIGDVFETDGTTTRTYYHFGAATVGYREHTTSTDDRYYLTRDHLGSTATVIDASDLSVTDQYYYPYGEPRTTWSISIDRGFTGQTSDHAQTGLYDHNARYYDPEIHRFISADTIIPNPANPQTLNRYSYVGNNPATYTDPTGNYLVGSDNYCTGCRKHYTYYSGPAGTLTYEYDHDGTRILPTTVDAAAPDPDGTSIWDGVGDAVAQTVGTGWDAIAPRLEKVAACVWDQWTCTTNIAVGVSPLLTGATTVFVLSEVVVVCGLGPLACAVSLPLLSAGVGSGVVGTLELAQEVWMGDSAKEKYGTLHAPWRNG